MTTLPLVCPHCGDRHVVDIVLAVDAERDRYQDALEEIVRQNDAVASDIARKALATKPATKEPQRG